MKERPAGRMPNLKLDSRESVAIASYLISREKEAAADSPPFALDSAKVRGLGWAPASSFDHALASTVEWYRAHEAWWKPIKSGAFRQYYRTQYAARS